MSQQLLKQAAPVLKRMPLPASLLSSQVQRCVAGNLFAARSQHPRLVFALQARSTAEILHKKQQEDSVKLSGLDESLNAGPADAPRAQTVLKVRSFEAVFARRVLNTWHLKFISIVDSEFQLAHWRGSQNPHGGQEEDTRR